MPACPGPSRREPAGTYAAIDTDRAAGRRAVITRGPSASAVLWNIAGMVPEQARRIGNRAAGARGAPAAAGSIASIAYLGRTVWSQPCRKNTRKAAETTHMSMWTSLILPRTTLIATHEMKPAPMPTVMS